MTLADTLANARDWMNCRSRQIIITGTTLAILVSGAFAVRYFSNKASSIPLPPEPKAGAAIHLKHTDGNRTLEFYGGAGDIGNILYVTQDGTTSYYLDSDPDQDNGIDVYGQTGKRVAYIKRGTGHKTPLDVESLMADLTKHYEGTVGAMGVRTLNYSQRVSDKEPSQKKGTK